MRTSRTAALLACLSLTGACRQAERPESRPADAAVAVAPDAGGSPDAAPAGPERGAESSAPAIVPGPQGPFIEPPLESKPATIAHVLVGRSDDLQALQSLRDEIGRLACVPIGYPAVDQAAGLAREGGWTLVAGKFARRAFAEAEAEALEQAGYDAQVVERAYYHDRFKPALNAAGFPRAGRLFAGIPGGSVPVLSEPRQDAPGSSRVLADGDLVALRAERWVDGRLWYELEGGFVSARRMLVDANLFPEPFGRRAVLGVSLGCREGQCHWDYWLVGRGLSPRKLLKPGGERMPHAFSPDGRWLAWSDFTPDLFVTAALGQERFGLGPGTSPSWSRNGRELFYRLPGVRDQRDSIMTVDASAFQPGRSGTRPRLFYDLKGTPYYPKAMSTIPPPVDFLERDTHLFTLFFRAAEKKGKVQVQRWGVLLTPEGKVIDKKGVLIGE